MSARSYCFTSYLPMELIRLLETELPTEISYCIVSLELCPSTQNYHLQGYVQLIRTMRMGQVKAILRDNSLHLEPTHGTAEQAQAYCNKPDKVGFVCGPWEFGSFKTQGFRSDMKDFIEELYDKSIKEVALNNPTLYIKYRGGFDKIKHMIDTENPSPYHKLIVNVRWGLPGTGKTRYVYDTHGAKNIFKLKINNGKCWWDGYYDQSVVLLDDFYGSIPLENLLDILDGYPKNYEVKGGFVVPKYTIVYITSNKSPATWYPGGKVPNALCRRITNNCEITGNIFIDCNEVLEGNTALEPDNRYSCLNCGFLTCDCKEPEVTY